VRKSKRAFWTFSSNRPLDSPPLMQNRSHGRIPAAIPLIDLHQRIAYFALAAFPTFDTVDGSSGGERFFCGVPQPPPPWRRRPSVSSPLFLSVRTCRNSRFASSAAETNDAPNQDWVDA
jgi:hypothetical protein